MKCAECSKQIPDGFVDCPWCGATPRPASTAAARPAFKMETLRPIVFAILSWGFVLLILWLNYRKALVWAGVINPESVGYMFGGVLFSFLMGFLVAYVVKKARGKSMAPASKALAVTGIAVLFSVYGLAQEMATSRVRNGPANHHLGALFKEAAGKDGVTTGEDWVDTATRETMHDVLLMNQQYAAEKSALDRSAIQNLYSADSYAGATHMQKVVSQLRGSLALDEKYSSLDPIIKKMEERVSAANAPEKEKQDYLRGVRLGLQQTVAPRTELIHKEEEWTKSAVDLYQFMIAHTVDYSIQDNKLIIADTRTRKEFGTLQSKSIALHKELRRMRGNLVQARDEKLDQMGLSTSDFTPAQMGKTK